MSVPHGRGWDYVGHGFSPDLIPVSQVVRHALADIDRQWWSRTIGWGSGVFRELDDKPGGGWFEYRLSNRRLRKRSRLNGRFLASDDEW